MKTLALFLATALAEIVGCYLPWLWLRQGKPVWLLLPAAVSLALFAWLLTLHPTAAGRTYAAYGGMYLAVALVWLRVVVDVRGLPVTLVRAAEGNKRYSVRLQDLVKRGDISANVEMLPGDVLIIPQGWF